MDSHPEGITRCQAPRLNCSNIERAVPSPTLPQFSQFPQRVPRTNFPLWKIPPSPGPFFPTVPAMKHLIPPGLPAVLATCESAGLLWMGRFLYIQRLMSAPLSALKNAVRDVPDFPKPGIIFKDITPILENGELFRAAVDCFVEANRPLGIEKIVCIDARGFLFGAAAAYALGIGFVPIRKKGKLPYHTEAVQYSLEYGEAAIEVHRDAIKPGERLVLIDDLLATGGTARAAIELLEKMKGTLVEIQFLIELSFLHGRDKLRCAPVRSFIKF